MKRLLYTCFLLICFTTVSGYAQNERELPPVFNARNEIKFNIASTLWAYPELSYERILSREIGLGLSGAFSLESESKLQYQATPYCRMYFGRYRPASGFFIEANVSVAGQKGWDYTYYDYSLHSGYQEVENKPVFRTNFGVGVAMGFKFLTWNGFTGEVYGGLGRIFANNDIFNDVYPRCGVTLGKRF